MRKANANSRRYEVLDALRKDPRMSFREIGKKLNMAIVSVHHHVHKLEEEGWISIDSNLARSIRVHNYPMPKAVTEESERKRREGHAKREETRKRLQEERGTGSLPRLTAAEQSARIEMVVAKAQEKDECRMNVGDADVVRINRSPWGWGACKVG